VPGKSLCAIFSRQFQDSDRSAVSGKAVDSQSISRMSRASGFLSEIWKASWPSLTKYGNPSTSQWSCKWVYVRYPFDQTLLGPTSSQYLQLLPPEGRPDHGCLSGPETAAWPHWRPASLTRSHTPCIRGSHANNTFAYHGISRKPFFGFPFVPRRTASGARCNARPTA
jgi:hypothetical protein